MYAYKPQEQIPLYEIKDEIAALRKDVSEGGAFWCKKKVFWCKTALILMQLIRQYLNGGTL